MRSEQNHRSSNDSHVPYRGEPGPLYRADSSSHHEDSERRRVESSNGRGDSSGYSQWFRNPSKIHKPGKKKLRRYPPHVAGPPRPLHMSKSDSPVMSRIGYHAGERGTSRQDSQPGQPFRTGVLGSSSKWSLDANSSKSTGASPRYDRENSRRLDKPGRQHHSGAPVTKGSMHYSARGDVDMTSDHSRPLGGSSNIPVHPKNGEKLAAYGKSKMEESRSTNQNSSYVRRPSNGIGNGKPLTTSAEQIADGRWSAPPGRQSDSPRRMGTINPVGERASTVGAGRSGQEYGQDTRRNVRRRGDAEMWQRPSSDYYSSSQRGRMSPPEKPWNRDISSFPAAERRNTSGRDDILKPNLVKDYSTKSSTIVGASRDDIPGTKNRNDLEANGEDHRNSVSRPTSVITSGSPALNRRRKLSYANGSGPANSDKAINHELTHQSIHAATSKEISQPVESVKASPTDSSSKVVNMAKEGKQHSNRLGEHIEMKSIPDLKVKRTVATHNADGNIVQDAVKRHVKSPRLRSQPNLKQSANAKSKEKHLLEKTEEEPCTSASVPDVVRNPRSTGQDTSQAHSSKLCKQLQVGQAPPQGIPGKEMLVNGVSPSISKIMSSPKATPPNGRVETEKPSPPLLPEMSLLSALQAREKRNDAERKSEEKVSSLHLTASSSTKKSDDFLHGALGDEQMTPTPPKLHAQVSINQAVPSITASPVASHPVRCNSLRGVSSLCTSPKDEAHAFGERSVSLPNMLSNLKHSRTAPKLSAKAGHVGRGRANDLVAEINTVDVMIRSKERELAQARARLKRSTSQPEDELETTDGKTCVTQIDKSYAEMASRLADRSEDTLIVDETHSRTVSSNPLHAELQLILTKNKGQAGAAQSALLHVSHGFGTESVSTFSAHIHDSLHRVGRLSEELRGAMTSELRRRKQLQTQQRKACAQEYVNIRRAWVQKLKHAREKRTKEKKDAARERDRYLVMCTKGTSALMSSRTSSGRMSMKVVPSLSASGHSHGNAEIDALLGEIAAAGGTPGFKDIWSKTLATIPDQNIAMPPRQAFSVPIEDPIADLIAHRNSTPWTFTERLVFLEKYATYPKNFRKIASFLEFKSERDCCQFYYLNKLDLGLKQLAREASTLKRKGLLKSHIAKLAGKRIGLENTEMISKQLQMFVNPTSVSPLSSREKVGVTDTPSQTFLGNETCPIAIKRSLESTWKLAMKKRIVRESGFLDISGIDEGAFVDALRRHGTNWKDIASAMNIPNKASSHYREYFIELADKPLVKDALLSWETKKSTKNSNRSATPTPKQSQRTPPKRSTTTPVHIRLNAQSTHDMMDLNSEAEKSHGKASPTVGDPISATGHHQDISANGMHTTKTSTPSKPQGNSSSGIWIKEERERFKQLFKKYGKDWNRISEILGSKTAPQVKGYWRRVAHEVGPGFRPENGKVSKSGKKKRRSHSSNDSRGHNGKRHGERRSPSGKQHGNNVKDESLKKLLRKVVRNTDEETKRPEEREVRNVEGIEVNGKSFELDKETGDVNDELKDTKRADTSTPKTAPSSNGKLPMLRSVPPPVLRSAPPVAVKAKTSSPASGKKRKLNDEDRVMNHEQAKLQRTAETHVLGQLEKKSKLELGD